VAILQYHDALAELLDSRTLCQLSATSRQLSDSFQSRARQHGRMFQYVMGAPEYGIFDLVSVQSWQYHSSFMVNILNGNVTAVEFVVQLGVDVNQPERWQEFHSNGCDMCQESHSKLLEYTFWEVACTMASSESPSPRRQKIRDLLRKHGGLSSRNLGTKRKFMKHLHTGYDHEPCRCRLVEGRLIQDSDDEHVSG